MKKLFVLSILCFGCAILLSAEEYILKVNNNSADRVSNFPVVFKLAALGGSIHAENCRVQIFDAEAKEIPSQLDDMNLDGKADETDEAAMLADLKPGENVFKVKLLPGRFPAPQSAEKRELYLAAENGTVRIEQSKLKLQQRLISRCNNGKYERIAGHFVQELNIDNSWKWTVRPEIRAMRVSSGAVRQIIRFASVVENRESGKQAEIINDMHIFSGRSEVFLRFQLTNISKGQLLQPCRVNQGFYDTGINGKVIISGDNFSGLGNKGETVSGSVAAGSYNYRNRSGKAPVWMNYFRSGVGGVGFAVNDLTHFDSCCIVYQPQRKIMRFSWLYCPKNLVLWPGKSLDLHSWLVIGNGNAEAAAEFAKTLHSVSL